MYDIQCICLLLRLKWPWNLFQSRRLNANLLVLFVVQRLSGPGWGRKATSTARSCRRWEWCSGRRAPKLYTAASPPTWYARSPMQPPWWPPMSSSSTFSTAEDEKRADWEKLPLVVPIETHTWTKVRRRSERFVHVYRKQTRMRGKKRTWGMPQRVGSFQKERNERDEMFCYCGLFPVLFCFFLGLCKAASKGALCQN